MKGCLATGEQNTDELVEKARAWRGMAGLDCVPLVSRTTKDTWNRGVFDLGTSIEIAPPDGRFHVVAIDFGIKENIMRLLAHHGARVTVVPGNTGADEILDMSPDGVFLGNGIGRLKCE